VEDDPLVRDVTMKVLEREGFHVIGAATPKRAIEITHDLPRPVDVLVSDVALPEMNGFQLARLLQDENKHLRIVFVSGYSRDSFEGQDMKDMQFLAKPFTPQSLLDAVRQATSPRHQND
jgi:CheY-like chemotaxis protein